MVKFLRILMVVSLIAGVASAQQASAPPQPAQRVALPPPSADEIVVRAVDTLGGAAWPQSRYFAFTLTIERDGKLVSSFPQAWDRVTGDYRVSGKDPQGRPFEVIMNVNTMEGRATLGGEAITDRHKLKDILTNVGYRRFVNDVFWFLMPLRMTEVDVKREYAGERRDSCGRVWDIVKLTFGKTALLPGDVYWAWVNRDTNMVEEWDMKLQSSSPDDRPTEVLMHDYRRVGGLLISLNRELRGLGQYVRLNAVQILPATPKGAFE